MTIASGNATIVRLFARIDAGRDVGPIERDGLGRPRIEPGRLTNRNPASRSTNIRPSGIGVEGKKAHLLRVGRRERNPWRHRYELS